MPDKPSPALAFLGAQIIPLMQADLSDEDMQRAVQVITNDLATELGELFGTVSSDLIPDLNAFCDLMHFTAAARQIADGRHLPSGEAGA